MSNWSSKYSVNFTVVVIIARTARIFLGCIIVIRTDELTFVHFANKRRVSEHYVLWNRDEVTTTRAAKRAGRRRMTRAKKRPPDLVSLLFVQCLAFSLPFSNPLKSSPFRWRNEKQVRPIINQLDQSEPPSLANGKKIDVGSKLSSEEQFRSQHFSGLMLRQWVENRPFDKKTKYQEGVFTWRHQNSNWETIYSSEFLLSWGITNST